MNSCKLSEARLSHAAELGLVPERLPVHRGDKDGILTSNDINSYKYVIQEMCERKKPKVVANASAKLSSTGKSSPSACTDGQSINKPHTQTTKTATGNCKPHNGDAAAGGPVQYSTNTKPKGRDDSMSDQKANKQTSKCVNNIQETGVPAVLKKNTAQQNRDKNIHVINTGQKADKESPTSGHYQPDQGHDKAAPDGITGTTGKVRTYLSSAHATHKPPVGKKSPITSTQSDQGLFKTVQNSQTGDKALKITKPESYKISVPNTSQLNKEMKPRVSPGNYTWFPAQKLWPEIKFPSYLEFAELEDSLPQIAMPGFENRANDLIKRHCDNFSSCKILVVGDEQIGYAMWTGKQVKVESTAKSDIYLGWHKGESTFLCIKLYKKETTPTIEDFIAKATTALFLNGTYSTPKFYGMTYVSGSQKYSNLGMIEEFIGTNLVPTTIKDVADNLSIRNVSKLQENERIKTLYTVIRTCINVLDQLQKIHEYGVILNTIPPETILLQLEENKHTIPYFTHLSEVSFHTNNFGTPVCNSVASQKPILNEPEDAISQSDLPLGNRSSLALVSKSRKADDLLAIGKILYAVGTVTQLQTLIWLGEKCIQSRPSMRPGIRSMRLQLSKLLQQFREGGDNSERSKSTKNHQTNISKNNFNNSNFIPKTDVSENNATQPLDHKLLNSQRKSEVNPASVFGKPLPLETKKELGSSTKSTKQERYEPRPYNTRTLTVERKLPAPTVETRSLKRMSNDRILDTILNEQDTALKTTTKKQDCTSLEIIPDAQGSTMDTILNDEDSSSDGLLGSSVATSDIVNSVSDAPSTVSGLSSTDLNISTDSDTESEFGSEFYSQATSNRNIDADSYINLKRPIRKLATAS